MIGLIGALRHEMSGVMDEMTVTRSVFQRGLHLFEGEYAGREVVLVQTGMGRDRARKAAEYSLGQYTLIALISFGFGGSLASNLRIGDIVLCREFHCHSIQENPQIHQSHKDLIDSAARVMESKRVNYLAGALLTVDTLVSRPGEKAKLGEIYPANVVDMESFWIAEAAARRGIPFLGVRAISDTFDQLLPPFDRFIDGEGRWLPTEMFRHFLLHPADLKTIPILFEHSRQARKSLAGFLRELIPAIPLEANGEHDT